MGTVEGANAVAFPLMSVLVFISSAFVTTTQMPAVLRVYAEHQPVTAAVDASRALMFGGPAAADVVTVLIWTGVMTLCFGSLAVLVYRRSAR
jgi:ABC-type multidrug transport system permease subunit